MNTGLKAVLTFSQRGYPLLFRGATLAGVLPRRYPPIFWIPAMLKNNGFTKLPNEFLEHLAKIRLSGEENQLLYVIIRKTWGFQKKEDSISLSQFAESTGINKQNVCRAINKLLSKKIITIIKKDKGISKYSIDARFGLWEPLSKKITLSKKIITIIKKDKGSLSKKIPTKETITKETITKENSGNSKTEIELAAEFIKTTFTDTFFNSLGVYWKSRIKKHIDALGIDGFKVTLTRWKEYHDYKFKKGFANRFIKLEDNIHVFSNENEYNKMLNSHKRMNGVSTQQYGFEVKKKPGGGARLLNDMIVEIGRGKGEKDGK